NLPLKWSADDNIHWKTKIPGVGHSSPVIHGDRVYLTTCLLKEQERVLLCLDRHDGKILWRRVVLTAPLEKKHPLNSFASATPAAEAKSVGVSSVRVRDRQPSDDYPRQPREANYVPRQHVSEMIVACYTAAGDPVWRKSPGQFYSRHGFCTSPILYKDMLILN